MYKLTFAQLNYKSFYHFLTDLVGKNFNFKILTCGIFAGSRKLEIYYTIYIFNILF